MGAHTPGPWDVDEGDGSIYSLETQETVLHGGVHEIFWSRPEDARLAIAAPDLLEALTELLLYHDVPGPVDAVLAPLIRAAFAAITKATSQPEIT